MDLDVSPVQGRTISEPLFRPEVAQARAERLEGSISIAVPLSWQVIGYALLAALAAVLLFLSLGTYSKVQSAPGVIVLDRGIDAVLPSRPGVIYSISVREGEHVRAGQPLLAIRPAEALTSGGTIVGRTREAIELQDRELARRAGSASRAAEADQARMRAQAAGALAEIADIQAQIIDQRRLVEIADEDLRNVQRIAHEGFISRHNIQDREALLIARRQQLSQLSQQQSAKRAEIAQIEQSVAASSATAQADDAGTASQRASITQQLVQAEAGDGYVLLAPVDGTVTALVARVGQAAASDRALLNIVPSNAHVRAELYLPSQAVSYVVPGQPVRLALEAFPYDRFGTVEARVTSVSATTIARDSSNGTTPVYLVVADLPRPWVMAFGRHQPLLPGMTLSAKIIVDRRSLIQWLFEPLFAVRA
jgi:membrane fusion protein